MQKGTLVVTNSPIYECDFQACKDLEVTELQAHAGALKETIAL